LLTKKLLSPSEIQKLIELVKKVFEYITELHRDPVGKNIQYPKLPPRLTESLAVYVLRAGLIPDLRGYSFDFGGNEADVIATHSEDTRKIEVKGTTKSFEFFGPKDITADYLLWFDFQNLRKKEGTDRFDLLILSQPSKYFTRPEKILIPRLRKITRNNLISKPFSTSTLLGTLISTAPEGEIRNLG